MANAKKTEEALYSTDNGRILCTAHLGRSAATTGRDISGQEIYLLTAADLATLAQMLGDLPVGCESCLNHKSGPRLVLVQGGVA